MYLKLQGHTGTKNSSAFLKAATTTLLHTISESEKASYVEHINNYLAADEFLKKIIPIDPLTDNLFEIAKDGVLMWCVFLSSNLFIFFIFFNYLWEEWFKRWTP